MWISGIAVFMCSVCSLQVKTEKRLEAHEKICAGRNLKLSKSKSRKTKKRKVSRIFAFFTIKTIVSSFRANWLASNYNSVLLLHI